jgi:hypothetical protein
VAEVEAYSGSTNVALAANGGRADGSGSYDPYASTPDKAIDGVKPAGYPNIYHSMCYGGDRFIVNFASAVPISSIVVYGRQDFGADRDVYHWRLYNGGTVVDEGTIDATSGSGSVTVAP